MGASDWAYKTTFDPDPSIALQRLREEVFRSGKYGYALANVGLADLPPHTPLAGKLFFCILAASFRLTAMVSWVFRGFTNAKSIDDPVAFAGESGTHSILDIPKCASQPGFACAWPASKRLLEKSFGTDRPQEEAVDRWAAQSLSRDLNRWECVYFPVYRDGLPCGYYFVGSSGD